MLRRGTSGLATVVATVVLAPVAPATAQQVIPVEGGPPVEVPAFDPSQYADAESCQLALNAAINALAARLATLPAVTPPATNTPAALAISDAMDRLSAQRPACLALGGGGGGPSPATPSTPPVVTPPAPLDPLDTPEPDASGKVDCGPVTVGGRELRLVVHGLTCEEARDVLAGVPTGWQCFGAPGAAGERRLLCRRTTAPPRSTTGWAFALPGDGGRCAPVKVGRRRWDVHRRAVTCRYARNTALRGLRGDDPIVYEFVSQGQPGRWTCRRYGAGDGRYGLCVKAVENRFVAWMPSARRR